ncbi:MAG TPA: PBP1A family penicillin-binding protein, partial [Rhizomicrobium sp.]
IVHLAGRMRAAMHQILEAFLRGVDDLHDWAVAHRHILTKICAWIAGIIVVPVAGLFLLPYLIGLFAPKLDLSQDLYALNRPVAYTFLDATGEIVGRRGALVGERLTLDQMPAYLPAAFIAMEDRRFYSHHGIDPKGLLRALWVDLLAGQWVAGGSTISQQTAKVLFTNSERKVSRKLIDMIDAVALEKSLSKKQILELYLNRLYLGSGAYGVDGAAHVYFGKSAQKLTLAEAAMLATLTRAPSVFSPRRDLGRAQQRADVVLDSMVDTGAISEAEAAEARAHPAIITDRTVTEARNFYLDTAAEEAQRKASAGGRTLSGDLKVHTTLDPRLQEVARLAARKVILGKQGKTARASEAAVMVMKPDGAVVALIGGVDYTESTFNRVTQAHRQPGSAFKPFVYMAALEAGLMPWDVRDDTPVNINGWTPTNYGGRSYGVMTLAEALAHSVNTVTARLAQEVGLDSVIDAARRCGITSKLEANASIALGTSEVTPWELTRAYGTIAAGGIKLTPYLVTEVDGADGRVLYRRTAPEQSRVIAQHVVRDLTAMMYGVMTEGTGRGASIWTHEAAGKTGTTQDYHDAWFVGFTADYVAAVWVGNDDASPMRGVTGGTLPARIWREVMTAAEKGLPARPLDRSPPGEPIDMEITSSGISLTTDDEAATMQQEQLLQPPEQQGEQRKGFWDWLFGSGEEKRPARNSGQDDESGGWN